MLAAVLSAALTVQVHVLRDLRDPLHQGAAQTFLGVALLVEVRVVGQHLLAFVDLQLGVELLQLILWKPGTDFYNWTDLLEQASMFSGMLKATFRVLTGRMTDTYVLRVQTVLAPGRRDAVVEVGARSSHVQLLLISLSGDIIPGLCSLG